MKDFHNLKVWERAHHLTLEIYRITKDFPREELYGITSQMRRSCSSIPSNIAEGYGRNGKAEIIQFFNIAIGSACELEYQLILAHDLKYLDDVSYSILSVDLIETRKMLFGFIQRLKSEN